MTDQSPAVFWRVYFNCNLMLNVRYNAGINAKLLEVCSGKFLATLEKLNQALVDCFKGNYFGSLYGGVFTLRRSFEGVGTCK